MLFSNAKFMLVVWVLFELGYSVSANNYSPFKFCKMLSCFKYFIVRKFRGKKISRIRPFAKFSWFRGNLILWIKENYAFRRNLISRMTKIDIYLFSCFWKRQSKFNISFRLLTRFYVLHIRKKYGIIHNC